MLGRFRRSILTSAFATALLLFSAVTPMAANIDRWTAPGAWSSSSFTATDFNSLAAGSSVFSAAITNTSNDVFADLSLKVKVNGTTGAGDRFDIYLLPVLQNGTIYGDNSAAGATPPVGSYYVGAMIIPSGITTGNFVYGRYRGIVLPPNNSDTFKLVIVNKLTPALNAAAAAEVYIEFYNENLNG